MSTHHGKMLYSTEVDGMKCGNNTIKVGVYGIFTSTPAKGNWEYYLISYIKNGNDIVLTEEWHGYQIDATYLSIIKHSKKVQTLEEGKLICEEYKSKWISGSNDTLQHKRNEKLNDILEDN